MPDIATEDLDAIRENYPGFIGFLNVPEIAELLVWAAKAQWSAAKLQAYIWNTDWWKNTPEPGRQALAMQIVDPSTWNIQVGIKASQLRFQLMPLGISATDDQLRFAAAGALTSGMSDQELLSRASLEFTSSMTPETARGAIANTASQIKARGADYGVQISDQSAFDFSRVMAAQWIDDAYIDDHFRKQAKALYANNADLVGALDAGLTVRQFADPYIQAAAQELEINPNDISLFEDQFSRPLRSTSEDGHSMPLYEWQRILRSDPVYGYDKTTGARTKAAQMADQFLTMFGAKG